MDYYFDARSFFEIYLKTLIDKNKLLLSEIYDLYDLCDLYISIPVPTCNLLFIDNTIIMNWYSGIELQAKFIDLEWECSKTKIRLAWRRINSRYLGIEFHITCIHFRQPQLLVMVLLSF